MTLSEPFLNPFQQVYDKLWEMAENDDRLTDVVKMRNRITFGDPKKSAPLKTQISSADFPELMLLPAGAQEINIQNTSSNSKIVKNYSWVINTGDFRTTKLFPVEWALFALTHKWHTELTTLMWETATDSYVKKVNFVGWREGQSEENQKQRTTHHGWSAVLDIFVEMHFTASHLRS